MGYVMGIDTSNYTTSLAIMDLEGTLVTHERIMLEVPQGEKGIRQSKALFYHIKNLPQIMERLPQGLKEGLVAICVSTRPRPVEGSYLPVFLAGEEVARCLAAVMELMLFPTSHQEGHIMALLWALSFHQKTFLACHFSGGTTEVHLVKREGPSLELEPLGLSLDLYAGQFIDGIGVEMGLPFPAGPSLERLALESQGEGYSLPTALKGLDMSFSGPASAAKRALHQGVPKASLARGVEESIMTTAFRVLLKASQATGVKRVLLVGGVFSNRFITTSLKESLNKEGLEVFMASPEYSRDGAVGQAFNGVLLFQEEEL